MTVDQKKLLDHINAVSFAAYDTMLFLDTHPDCMEAKNFYCKMMDERNKSMCEYQEKYEPLICDGPCMCHCDKWTWATTPWPWERRGC